MRLHLSFVLSLVLISCPLASHSQTTQPVVSGDRVRLSARSLGTDARVGIVTKVDGDRLSLVDPGVNGAAWDIPPNRLDGLEFRRVNEGNNKHKGALIGMITGFVAFGVIGYVATTCPNGCDFDRMGVLAAGPGGGIGAYIGAQIGKGRKADAWVPVSLPLKVSLTPTRRGRFQFSASVVF